MAFKVDTFGPYQITDAGDLVGTGDFWKKTDPKVAGAYGVYVFAEQRKDGSFYPWYVGRTLRNYKVRLNSHFRTRKILSAIKNKSEQDSSTYVFFVAFLSAGRGAVAKKTASREKWVKYLEIALIGRCWPINREMINEKETHFFEEVPVPGYLDEPSKRHQAAKAFALMLDGPPKMK